MERYQQVKELFQSALERETVERLAFLDQACAGDASLRQQVEALLACHEQAGDFLAVPACGAAAELLGEEPALEMEGRRLGPYRIEREIGRGGMGAVYLATRA